MIKQPDATIFWFVFAIVAIVTMAFDLSQPAGAAGGIACILVVLLGLLTTQLRVTVALTRHGLNALLNAADKAQNQAKHSGRNQVKIAGYGRPVRLPALGMES